MKAGGDQIVRIAKAAEAALRKRLTAKGTECSCQESIL